jgi:hypothetical protein
LRRLLTYVFQDSFESLEHILVSKQLYDNSKRRRRLFDGPIVNNDSERQGQIGSRLGTFNCSECGGIE